MASAALNAQRCGCYTETAGSRWYCLETNVRSEIVAFQQITKLGIRAHLPLYVAGREQIKAPQQPKGKRKLVIEGEPQTIDQIRPLFPGYMFVRFDVASNDWKDLFRTVGVKRLFMASYARPIPVPSGIVEALMARGRPGDGVIDDKYDGPPMPGIAVGEKLRITSGPFADLVGVCTMSTQQRVGLLLEVMGARVEVDRKNVVGA